MNPSQELEAFLGKHVPDNTLANPFRNTFANLAAALQADYVADLRAERTATLSLNGIERVRRIYGFYNDLGINNDVLNATHLDILRPLHQAPTGYPCGTGQTLDVLLRMKTRANNRAGYEEQDALRLAKDLIFPNGLKIRVDYALQRRVFNGNRLTQAQLRLVRAKLSAHFKDATLAAAAFLVAILAANGGRYEGLQHSRIKDIVWDSGRTLYLTGTKGRGNRRRRITWRLENCQKEVEALLKANPALKNHQGPLDQEALTDVQDVPLLFDPRLEVLQPLRTASYVHIMGRIARRVLKIKWQLGARAFRRFYISSECAKGRKTTSIQMDVGHVPGSNQTHRYVMFELEDLVQVCDTLGFTEGLHERTCFHCVKPMANADPLCASCKTWQYPSTDPDDVAVSEYADLGLDVLHLEGLA